jgi:eukaryotic-like serine/threonine-protein kinase
MRDMQPRARAIRPSPPVTLKVTMALLFMDDPVIHPSLADSQDASRSSERLLPPSFAAELPLHGVSGVSAADLNPPPQVHLPVGVPFLAVEDFRLERLAGSGGIAEVWLAHHPRFNHPVALKIARSTLAHNPHVEAQFARELQAAERLTHRGLVRHLGRGQTPSGRPFIVMEWVRGRPLSHFVHKPAHWNFLRIAIVQLCEALQYIHTEGVLHQDLKPANILVDFDQRRVKITDFGLASFERAAPDATTRHVLGTPSYMAPEQARGQLGKLGPHTDLYTVGVLLYELLCGHKPFSGETDQEVMLKHCTERPPAAIIRPSIQAPPAVERVLRRLLAKRPEHRYSSALSLSRIISALSAQDTDEVAA